MCSTPVWRNLSDHWSRYEYLKNQKIPSPRNLSRKVHEKVEPILTVCTADEKKVLPKQKTVQRMPIWNELFIDKK